MNKHKLFLLPIALLLGLALAFSCAPPDDDGGTTTSFAAPMIVVPLMISVRLN